MPIKYHCPAHEAGEPCQARNCLHTQEVGDNGEVVEMQYLFGNVIGRFAFDMLPEIMQQMVLQLCDLEYDERVFDIDS